mgnify:CR=1 FL=1
MKISNLKTVTNEGLEPSRIMHVIDKLSVSGSGIHGITRAIEWWLSYFNPQQFQFIICSLRSPEVAGEIFKKKNIPIYFSLNYFRIFHF